MIRFDNYWGDKAKTDKLIIRWSSEAAQRLVELLSPTVDGIDNVGPTDFDTVKNNPDLQLKERPGLNTFYVGMNNTYAPFDNEKVRQAIAMGIDRQRIVDNFYPPGSEVATHFTPCAIPNGCAGDDWYEFDPAKAKQMLADAGFPNGFDTVINYRDVVRSYLPDPKVVATDIQAQLKTNLNINAKIEVQESGTFLDNAAAGKLAGHPPPRLGRRLSGHHRLPRLPLRRRRVEAVRQQVRRHHLGADDRRPGRQRRRPQAGLRGRQQRHQAARPDDPDRARRLRRRLPGRRPGRALAPRSGTRYFAVMTPGDRTQFVFMQNAEPPGLYCADETDGESLRVCEQMTEALYAYEVGGTAAVPALATECKPNAELTQWTCTLRDGVTFHDGSTLDANDVVLSYAVQWDADNPLHKGRTGDFTYFPGLFGGFLNPPVPTE